MREECEARDGTGGHTPRSLGVDRFDGSLGTSPARGSFSRWLLPRVPMSVRGGAGRGAQVVRSSSHAAVRARGAKLRLVATGFLALVRVWAAGVVVRVVVLTDAPSPRFVVFERCAPTAPAGSRATCARCSDATLKPVSSARSAFRHVSFSVTGWSTTVGFKCRLFSYGSLPFRSGLVVLVFKKVASRLLEVNVATHCRPVIRVSS